MRSEWPSARLDELCLKIGSGVTPRGGSNTYVGDGVRFIRSQNVHDLQFEFAGLAHLDDIAASRLRNVTVQPGDVLVNITGDSVARACMAPDDGHEARVSQHVAIVRPDTSRVDAHFLVYWLVSQRVKSHLLALASAGATRKALTKTMLGALEIPLPPIKEQRRISSVLNTFTDKIDSNRRLALLSEELAAVIFRARFVDFVGVDKYEESTSGSIPMGWAVQTVRGLCKIVRNGGTPRRMESGYWDGGSIPWFRTGELNDSVLPRASKMPITERGLAESNCIVFPRGTILIAIYAAPTVGRIGILDAEGACNQACTALVPREAVGYPFLFWTLRELKDYFNGLASGSAQQNISKGTVESAPVLLPPSDLIEVFNAVALPQFQLIAALRRENEKLATVRDTLLPKLISGEIRVPDTNDPEEVIGPAAEELTAASR